MLPGSEATFTISISTDTTTGARRGFSINITGGGRFTGSANTKVTTETTSLVELTHSTDMRTTFSFRIKAPSAATSMTISGVAMRASNDNTQTGDATTTVLHVISVTTDTTTSTPTTTTPPTTPTTATPSTPDTRAPVITITSPADNSTVNTSTPLLVFTIDETVTTQTVRVDGSVVNKVNRDTLGPLSEGTHTVSIEATDTAGNRGTGQSTFRVTTTPSTGTPLVFSDVPAGAWYKPYVDNLTARGVISGYPNGRFYPDERITRAEFAKMVLLGIGARPSTGTATQFTDVSSTHWARGYVQRARELAIIKGFPNGEFRPNAAARRQEVATMAVRAGNHPPAMTYTRVFSDVPSTLWSWPFVNKASELKMISGQPNGNFGPLEYATRAEAARVVSVMMGLGI